MTAIDIEHPATRYRVGKLLELLARNEKLESGTHLDEYETTLVAFAMREYLATLWDVAELDGDYNE